MTVCEVCGVFINCTDAEQRQLAAAQALGKTALGNVTPVSKALGVRIFSRRPSVYCISPLVLVSTRLTPLLISAPQLGPCTSMVLYAYTTNLAGVMNLLK